MAIHPFSAEGPDELTIAPGETIELLERVGSEWMRGRLGDKEGIFPIQYVEVKVDLPPIGAGGTPSGQGSDKGRVRILVVVGSRLTWFANSFS